MVFASDKMSASAQYCDYWNRISSTTGDYGGYHHQYFNGYHPGQQYFDNSSNVTRQGKTQFDRCYLVDKKKYLQTTFTNLSGHQHP